MPTAACSRPFATSAVAVIAGEAVARLVPAIWVKRAAGLLFLVLGAFYLLGRE
jgi:putative Ca2+/H+ antiporter (TMEM165/GDT1 family)